MDLPAHVAERVSALLPPGAPVCVGLSGGLDSVVLLDLLQRAAPARPLSAVHVHHGLSPHADAWERHCAGLCAERGVPLDVAHVRVERDAGEGLEAAARRARYAVFAARPEPFVALAHHRDDQAETLMLQLLRGTGLKGLAAMPEVRALDASAVRIVRPLLDVARARLRTYARERALAWVDDESNAQHAQDRNFLRHVVAPRLDERFAGWREAAARLARHAGEAQALLDELAALDGVPGVEGAGLALQAGLSRARRANALRAFLAREGLAMPGAARLEEMAAQLYDAKEDARVRLRHDGALVVRRRGIAYVERALAPADGAPAWRVAWHGEAEVALGALGTVRFVPTLGAGLGAERAAQGDWHFAPRRGGERMRLDARRPSRTLKNLLQEAGIPEWRRDALPLLFDGERLAWVPGVGVAAEYACAPGSAGLDPAWHFPGPRGSGFEVPPGAQP